MKKLLPFLLVIVYLNNGQVLKYPTATRAITIANFFLAADDELDLYDVNSNLVATFELSNVSHWEVK